MSKSIGVWFPTIRAGTGVDRFTESLVDSLNKRGIRAEISWLPHRAEYLPWSVRAPKCPDWATVVHVNSWLHQRFIPNALPSVVTLHSCVHDEAFAPYKSFLQRLYHRLWVFRREKKALRNAAKITAVSKYTAHVSGRIFEVGDIVPIPNWIDAQNFRPAKVTKTGEKFRLVFVGNLSVRKGADLLPDIMKQLGPDFELLYTGRPDWYPGAETIPANMKGVGQLNGVSKIVSFYQNADVLIFPTRLEGLPLSVLEAMAVGLPVVCSDATSLPEVVVDGETGILCAQDDVTGFVEGVRKLASDPQLYENMRLASTERVRRFFSENHVIDNYIEIYKELTFSR